MSDVSDAMVPAATRLAFSHAVLQVIADEVHADLLHIKGVAADPSIGAVVGPGSDADVLVRPAHVSRFMEQLRRHGWQHYSDFEAGSPFGHAATFYHEGWGFGDVHRHFPGIGLGADEAFEELWAARTPTPLAGVLCAAPSLAAQMLIMVLNAARSGGDTSRMALVRSVWDDSPTGLRQEVALLIASLHAEVAFSAGLGDLEPYRGHSEYRLWKVASQGGTRIEEWFARVQAAPSSKAALRVALRAPLVNTEHLALRIGHPPSRLEVLREFVARPVRGAMQELARVRGAHR